MKPPEAGPGAEPMSAHEFGTTLWTHPRRTMASESVVRYWCEFAEAYAAHVSKELVGILELVRMSNGWRYLARESQVIIEEALRGEAQ